MVDRRGAMDKFNPPLDVRVLIFFTSGLESSPRNFTVHRVASQHRDHNMTTDYRDVTSPIRINRFQPNRPNIIGAILIGRLKQWNTLSYIYTAV